ncbi:hypothetical protein LMH87_004361 [Akanthomyces muscarius]|uniref:Uncharacterized protein n=1 Tax=Akanthomyces muscarius TaxID=2231603 RepID=A0A9W8UHK3_AKAMU|nr:hypothetical protein LMH87_004361 [Akanthomyces muscarius]KAJ4145513.1 hypothetical protein LMH87_004361 [Akanthomyces muscarius]
MQFDCSATDGTSTLVLLQAALANALVNAFLSNPYFLVEDGVALQKIESQLVEESSIETATNWRASTVRSLEKSFSLEPKFIEARAEQFVKTFGFLLQELDRSALADLLALFTSFSEIALKLWQTPTQINIVGMRDIYDWGFSTSCPYVECEAVVASALGCATRGPSCWRADATVHHVLRHSAAREGTSSRDLVESPGLGV